MVFVATIAACSPSSSKEAGSKTPAILSADPIIKIRADESAPGLSFLSWDTEGGEKAATNLLRAGSAVRVQFFTESGAGWQDAKVVSRRTGSGGDVTFLDLDAGGIRLEWRVEAPGPRPPAGLARRRPLPPARRPQRA